MAFGPGVPSPVHKRKEDVIAVREELRVDVSGVPSPQA